MDTEETSWPFCAPANAAVITTTHVVDGLEPILFVSHGENDEWHFSGQTEASPECATVVSLQQIVRLDREIVALAELPTGWRAFRPSVSQPWRIVPCKSDEPPDSAPSLDSRDEHIVSAAEGWHMMMEYEKSAEELRGIGPEAMHNPKALHLMCRVHWGLRQIEVAMLYVDRLIALQPDHPFAYGFKAMLLGYTGDVQGAATLLNSIIHKFPAHATMHYDLAQFSAKLNRWSEALHWARISLAINPNFHHLIFKDPLFEPIQQQLSVHHVQ